MEKKDYEKSVLEYEDVQEAIAYAKELAAKETFGKGLEEGAERGREEGREEATILIAQNMLKNGLDIFTIAAVTGLTENEILHLTAK